jgi:hypothetical protein
VGGQKVDLLPYPSPLKKKVMNALIPLPSDGGQVTGPLFPLCRLRQCSISPTRVVSAGSGVS